MRNNLINFRKKIGMTQEEFGAVINLDKQKVCNIELGIIKGNATTWLTIQKKFNLTNEQTLDLMEVIPNERT